MAEGDEEGGAKRARAAEEERGEPPRPRRPPAQAVLFDLDGTLVDTEVATCDYIADLLRPHGLEWTAELHRKIAGTMHFFPGRCLELLGVPPARREELLGILPPRLTSPEYSAFVARRMELKPGASALIRRLQSMRVPLGLCTSRRGDGLADLEALRPDLRELLLPLAARVVGSVDPRTGRELRGKPDPEVYSVCAELLGADAKHCVVFEDAPAGLRSAKAAGAFTVAVPEAWMEGDADAEAAIASSDLRLASLEALAADPPSLLALLGRGHSPGAGLPPPLLVGCGNATVDVTVEVTRADLARFGLSPGGEAAGLDDRTKADIVDFACGLKDEGPPSAAPGGAALNAIRVAAWCGGEALRTAFVGAVGRDDHGEVLRRAMAEVGVVPLLKEAADGLRTGVCASLVERETRDRTLAAVRGASACLDPAFLDEPGVAALLEEASLLYLTSFVLTTEPRVSAAEALAARTLARGGALAVNLSSSGLLAKVREPLLRLLPKCTYVFGNVGELRALGALLGWQETDDARLAARLAALLRRPEPPRGSGGGGAAAAAAAVAVITAGASATLVAASGGEEGVGGGGAGGGAAGGAVRRFPAPAVAKGEIMDTNGAGDAFVGGFLARAVAASPGGRPAAAAAEAALLEECVTSGHRCAAFVLRRQGCDLRGVAAP